ncbi:hypothetical protein ACTID9_04585 [Brevibacillus fluminis]|uniref:hypothetical protein n=1 Tax=Brevibacillus fluminis TaxID=511487 RepID=UPI003F8AA488
MVMPAEAEQKSGTAFARHSIREIHPPRSVWHWRAVPLFCGAGLEDILAGIATAAATSFFANPLTSTKPNPNPIQTQSKPKKPCHPPT